MERVMDNDFDFFREWLVNNTGLSKRSISDTVSRAKRAINIIKKSHLDNDDLFLVLDRSDDYQKLNIFVKSQLRRSLTLLIESKKEL
jgi:hypothetical protein